MKCTIILVEFQRFDKNTKYLLFVDLILLGWHIKYSKELDRSYSPSCLRSKDSVSNIRSQDLKWKKCGRCFGGPIKAFILNHIRQEV